MFEAEGLLLIRSPVPLADVEPKLQPGRREFEVGRICSGADGVGSFTAFAVHFSGDTILAPWAEDGFDYEATLESVDEAGNLYSCSL